jgi:hypothetical protein
MWLRARLPYVHAITQKIAEERQAKADRDAKAEAERNTRR